MGVVQEIPPLMNVPVLPGETKDMKALESCSQAAREYSTAQGTQVQCFPANGPPSLRGLEGEELQFASGSPLTGPAEGALLARVFEA